MLLLEAGKRLNNLDWISLYLEDAVSFIENSEDNYDLITAIHFFPILSLNQKKRVISSALPKLGKAGRFLLVQPAEHNELTLVKKKLRKLILNEEYETSYFQTDLLPADVFYKVISKEHLFVITENEIPEITAFLLGRKFLNSSALFAGNKQIAALFHRYKRSDGKYEIQLSNNLIYFCKD